MSSNKNRLGGRALSLLTGCLLASLLLATRVVAGEGQVKVQWLGHSAFKITSVAGKVILIDPFLTKNPKTPPEYKDLAALGKVDLVLVTHAHGDHVGDGPAIAKQHQTPLYGPAGLNDTLVALGELPQELAPRFNKGATIQPLGEGIRITMTHAEHSSEYRWTNPQTNQSEIHVGGEPAGFIIELENGFKIFHMGDTGLFGDLGFIGSYYHPDLVLIPIGGHFTMDPKDAALATRDYLKPRYAIPIHYGTIPQLKGTPEEYRQALGETSTQVLILEPGEKVRL